MFLIESKVATVNVNIDGGTRETFEKVRVNLKFDRVTSKVRRLIDLRDQKKASSPKVRVGIIRQPKNQHEVEAFLKQWRGIADYVADDFLVSGGVASRGRIKGHWESIYRTLHRQGLAGQSQICAKCNWARPGPTWFQKNVV